MNDSVEAGCGVDEAARLVPGPKGEPFVVAGCKGFPVVVEGKTNGCAKGFNVFGGGGFCATDPKGLVCWVTWGGIWIGAGWLGGANVDWEIVLVACTLDVGVVTVGWGPKGLGRAPNGLGPVPKGFDEDWGPKGLGLLPKGLTPPANGLFNGLAKGLEPEVLGCETGTPNKPNCTVLVGCGAT